MVLLVWMFALAAGVANACLLERPGVSWHAATPLAAPDVLAADGVAGHPWAVGTHTADPQLPGSPCLKFCDDGSRVVPKLQAGMDHAEPGAALLIAVLWSLAAPMVVVGPGPSGLSPSGAPEPPIRLRYSRLAL